MCVCFSLSKQALEYCQARISRVSSMLLVDMGSYFKTGPVFFTVSGSALLGLTTYSGLITTPADAKPQPQKERF